MFLWYTSKVVPFFSQFTNAEKLSIEKALKCKGEGGNEYNLHQLRDVPGTISPDTFCELADRIDYIDSLNLHIDLTAISENKRKSITRHIANRRLSSLQRSAAENTYPSVAIYLHETRKFLQDLAIEANDSIVSNFIKKGDKRYAEIKRFQNKSKKQQILRDKIQKIRIQRKF